MQISRFRVGNGFPKLGAVVSLPILAGCDFGIQASMEDVTVINLSIGGLELNIPNLQLSSLSVNVGQSECRRFRDDHCKFEWDGKSGFLPVVLSSVLTNRLHGRSQILV